MLNVFIGIALGLSIGIGCRALDIPSPAPPTPIGALIVLAMTCGYVVAGYL